MGPRKNKILFWSVEIDAAYDLCQARGGSIQAVFDQRANAARRDGSSAENGKLFLRGPYDAEPRQESNIARHGDEAAD